MPSNSIALVAPKYRHLFPVAPDLTFRMPQMKGTQPPTSVLKTMTSDGVTSEQPLPVMIPGRTRETAQLWVTINDIPLNNEYMIVDYVNGLPVWGWSSYVYNRFDNTLIFLQPPPAGMVIAVYEITMAGGDGYTFLEIPRYLFVQGAHELPEVGRVSGDPMPEPVKYPDTVGENPIEVLRLPMNGPDGRFLGGFRCTVEILSPCVNGLARVSESRMGFEYRPKFGFTGRDSFAYRIVTPFGQQSDAACIQLFVGV